MYTDTTVPQPHFLFKSFLFSIWFVQKQQGVALARSTGRTGEVRGRVSPVAPLGRLETCPALLAQQPPGSFILGKDCVKYLNNFGLGICFLVDLVPSKIFPFQIWKMDFARPAVDLLSGPVFGSLLIMLLKISPLSAPLWIMQSITSQIPLPWSAVTRGGGVELDMARNVQGWCWCWPTGGCLSPRTSTPRASRFLRPGIRAQSISGVGGGYFRRVIVLL